MKTTLIKKIVSIVLLILIYNLLFYLQYLLRTELQLYLIGFRLNFLFVFNLILIYYHREKLPVITTYLKNFGKIKNWILIFFIPVISSILSILLIIQIGTLKYRKPEFLIEFGLTALLDIPIYYLWNLPLLLSYIVLIILLIEKFTFPRTLLFTFVLTLSYLIPGLGIVTEKFQFLQLSNLILVFGMILFTISVLRFGSSAWLSIFAALISIYSFVLVFGSKNSFVINTFFARNYKEWEGIFSIKKIEPEIIDLIYAGIIILFAIFFFIFDRRKLQ